MVQSLSVLLNMDSVGKLTFDGVNDEYSFEYKRSWLENNGYAISPHISEIEKNSEKIKRFLSNLLPEGKWLEELSVNNQISKSNIYGLIALIGKETTGALSFQYEDSNISTVMTSFREIPVKELEERIKVRNEISIAVWDNRQRLSTAGI